MAASRRYFCVSPSFFSHSKTLRLVDRIGDRGFHVPLMLMAYAADNQKDGDFSDPVKYPPFVLAKIFHLDVKGEFQAKRFMEALSEVGFFDPGTRKLHDFAEWNAYHVKRSESGRKAAQVRWARDGEREGEPPEPPPPPEDKKAPRFGKVSPRPRNETQPQSKDADPNRSTAPGAGNNKKALTERERFKRRMDLDRKCKALREVLEKHRGRPGSSTRWKSETEQKTVKGEYFELSAQLEDAVKEMATL